MLAGAILFVISSCAPKPLALPSGDGVPYAEYAAAFDAATAGCREIRSLTAELGLSGRAGRTRLRGRALVGAAAPDRIRLEALAPFGPPVFILAAHDGVGTLLLPRDDRVVEGEAPAAIVEALAGIRVDPATLRAAIAGCALDSVEPQSARAIGEGWLAVDAGDGRTIYLDRADDGGWRVRGARTPEFTLTYDEMGPRLPARITVRTQADGVTTAEVRLSVAGVDLDVSLGDEAFRVEIPESAAPLTLRELREAGPLGESEER